MHGGVRKQAFDEEGVAAQGCFTPTPECGVILIIFITIFIPSPHSSFLAG
jgi:hypothetical protein